VALFSYAMIFGASIFAKWMGYPHRYLIPSLMLWVICWTALILALIFPTFKFGFKSKSIALVVLIILTTVRFGLPSVNNVRRSLERRLAPIYSPVAETGCTHVTGDYYRVWDSVFYSRLIKGPELWGITGRSRVIEDKWDLKNFPHVRICYWKNNRKEAMEFLEKYNLPEFEEEQTDGPLVILNAINEPSNL